ncbi:MAG: FKBP-type peptidyl-prolyl cis-trans isomerase [Deltaproteobacteria bacterium]|nr:FKBP-type peptidyl-prolyl cis-trans isomerase [Deltaproteobacteria bacterium]MBK7068827.1 FKBP-type peptidyl-prolyl cis-trans isomerase [Deltaproteobacteria bacterium]MBK8694049.1 FKBP-type peptidyl-prolyl cis-trans isomerase [Deltaproteobacteria bacterium]MBP6832751.1 FKBP-type peptidyl-prolyl cis-trans isomerase [Deltaproteobacteria bacterium]
MRRWILCTTLALGACKPAAPTAPAPAANAPLTTDDQRTLYALGLVMGQRMDDFSLTPAELAVVQRGIADKVTGARAQVELNEWGPRINTMAQARQGRRSEQEKVRGRAYADTAARETGAERLPSGLVFRTLREGNGPTPTPANTVRVHYRGTLIDGTEFDSSYTRGEPVEFPLNGVVPCWTEGVQRIRVGGKARLVCPSDIAYGDRGQRGIPPGATLNFEVELIGIVGAPGAGDAAVAPTPTAPPTPPPGH